MSPDVSFVYGYDDKSSKLISEASTLAYWLYQPTEARTGIHAEANSLNQYPDVNGALVSYDLKMQTLYVGLSHFSTQ